MTDPKPTPDLNVEPNAHEWEPAAAKAYYSTQDLTACKVGAVKVKPLEWRDSYGVLRAETPFGDYKIAGKVLHHLGNPAPQSFHDSIEAAQAAAQADYERRILSALEPAPDARQEGRRGLSMIDARIERQTNANIF